MKTKIDTIREAEDAVGDTYNLSQQLEREGTVAEWWTEAHTKAIVRATKALAALKDLEAHPAEPVPLGAIMEAVANGMGNAEGENEDPMSWIQSCVSRIKGVSDLTDAERLPTLKLKNAAHPQTEDLDHALDELLTEVSCVIHSNGLRPIDIECLKSYYDKYHALIHRDMMDILGNIAGSAKPGPVVTHLNMDPNASPETAEAVKDMIQAAYKYKPQTEDLDARAREWWSSSPGTYFPANVADIAQMLAAFARPLSPSKGVDEQVEEIMEVVYGYLQDDRQHWAGVIRVRLKTLLAR